MQKHVLKLALPTIQLFNFEIDKPKNFITENTL